MHAFIRVSIRAPAALAFLASLLPPPALLAEPLPFQHKVEVYRDEEGDVMAFALRLEQPFLAEEFEKSNYLRLAPLDRGAYLVYPKETKFEQKHAEFYGRLRGEGKAKLRLSYEIVSENLDGSRRVDVREAAVEVSIPQEETGPASIYRRWAEEQNEYFNHLLSYYPDQTFFQYVLLQSADRYQVAPPRMHRPMPSSAEIEDSLYYTFSGGLSFQQILQRQTLDGGPPVGDLDIHISRLAPPSIRSLPYEDLLKERQEKTGEAPRLLEIARLVPADQYLLQFNSMSAAEELMDLSNEWGDAVLRLFTINAREQHLSDKLEGQLCLDRAGLLALFGEGIVTELAVTGSDPFIAEGSDLTVILRVAKPESFREAADLWKRRVRERHPQMLEREFNYRGHKVAAAYLPDRMVSSFVLETGGHAVYSSSHRAIRKIIETATGAEPNLHDSVDYRYASSLLPPSEGEEHGYVFASEAFLKWLVSPAFKISEKRRLQCFNNLVMLNNASLFYRLEHGESPSTLSDLVEGKFVNASKLVCPHGGAYAFDAEHDTCTCSLHNRIKYLTPNVELSVLNVSARERDEYARYRTRYEGLWKKTFHPLAARITAGKRVKIELAVLPFLNSSLYQDLRSWTDEKPQRIDTSAIASSAFSSLVLVPGREKVRDFLRQVPGVPEVLEMDPTLTDLAWIGDRISLHFCDESTVLEIDPTRLRTLNIFGETPVLQQSLVATAIYATSLPVYATVDVEDEEKAERLLHHLASRLFLKSSDLGGLQTSLDAYRLPEYEGHEIYVLSYQLYALKVRLYVALVSGRLVGATRRETLEDVIRSSKAEPAGDAREAHALLRLNRRALDHLRGELEIYWSEKSRQACHRNILSIYNLVKLYDTPIEDVDRLSDAKYGVTYFCPDGGAYRFDEARDQVVCTVHGNRQEARQSAAPEGGSAFARLIDGIEEIVATLRFEEEFLQATIEVERADPASKR